MSLVMISDIHLGRYKYGNLNPQTGLDLRTEDILSNVREAIKYAHDIGAKYLTILGDQYHLKRPVEIFREALAQVLREALEQGLEVFVILGNHDQGRTAAHDLVELHELSHLVPLFHVIDTPETFERGEYFFAFLPHVNQIKLNISNIEFFQYQLDKIKELSKAAQKSKAKYKIFFGHFGTDKSVAGKGFDIGSTGKSTRVIPLSIFDKTIWTRVYLGDIHKPQELNDFCRHVGSIAKVDFGEESEKKGLYHFENGNDKFIELHDREFKTLSVDLTNDARTSMEKFCDIVQDLNLSKAIVRLDIKIRQKDDGLINFKGIEEYLKGASWKYIGKGITQISDESEEVIIDEYKNLDYAKIFKDYVQKAKDQIDEDIFEDVLIEGEIILSEILNQGKKS
jgi:DNA repair exonuclease SbcCD nuclease subunit